jgi:cell wall assembly regulator SMI1
MNNLWPRLEAQLRVHSPDLASRLRPGASAAEVAAYEAETGYALPASLRASYLRHDGCDYVDNFPDCSVEALLGLHQWMPLEKSVLEWRGWRDSFNEDDAYFFGDDLDRSSWSESRIRPWQTTPPSWLPLGKFLGFRERTFVDMNPGPLGHVGQIVLCNPADRTGIEAADWGSYLTALTEGLEQGRLEMGRGPSRFDNEWRDIATGQPFRAPGFVMNCP